MMQWVGCFRDQVWVETRRQPRRTKMVGAPKQLPRKNQRSVSCTVLKSPQILPLCFQEFLHRFTRKVQPISDAVAVALAFFTISGPATDLGKMRKQYMVVFVCAYVCYVVAENPAKKLYQHRPQIAWKGAIDFPQFVSN